MNDKLYIVTINNVKYYFNDLKKLAINMNLEYDALPDFFIKNDLNIIKTDKFIIESQYINFAPADVPIIRRRIINIKNYHKKTKGEFTPLNEELIREMFDFAKKNEINSILNNSYKLIYISDDFYDNDWDYSYGLDEPTIHSVYFVSLDEKTLYRLSDHWGRVASCLWTIKCDPISVIQNNGFQWNIRGGKIDFSKLQDIQYQVYSTI